MGSVLSLLLAIFKAIPVLKKSWDQLMDLYIASELTRMKKENQDAINKAFDKQDQRPIEEALGSGSKGLRSGVSGSELFDSLPGVQNNNSSGSGGNGLVKQSPGAK